MARFDRYLLSQLLVLFGFFALVLVSVYWVNRAVLLFDQLIADGQSAGVFLEFTALSLPNVIRRVIPMAAFAASVYVTNRLSTESELTVMQATGFSPWRLARPVLYFGIVVALMQSVLTHVLVPTSLQTLKQREAEIATNLSARLLAEGTFLHPTRGVTFYIREIQTDGTLQDVFLSDRRDPDRSITYTAQEAYLVKSDAGARLVMVDGLAQTHSDTDTRLATTNFSDFSYDISGLIEQVKPQKRRIRHISTYELLTATEAVSEETGASLGRVLEEAHGRFHQPLLCIGAALVGFAALLIGGYSRFGLGRQIVFAIFLLVGVLMVESAVTEPVRANPDLWPLVYAPAAVGFAIVALLLTRASNPFGLASARRSRA